MANSKFSFNNSTHLKIEDEDTASFFCNSLEEKNKFIYFCRGDLETPDYACGTDKYKVRKELVVWSQTDSNCDTAGPIWKVEQKP
jgi:hypothetical protein